MTPAEFSKALLRSAKSLDVPAAGAKARAVAHLAGAAGAAGAGAAGAVGGSSALAGASAGVLGSKLGILAWSLVGAGAIAAGAVGFVLTRTPAETPPAITDVQPAPRATSGSGTITPDPSSLRGAAPAPASKQDDATAAAVDACMAHTIPDGPPTTCSKKGKPVPFDLRSACAGDVDVFWVGYDCQEVFHHRLGNGESWTQLTQDAHVWRIRDHATHALVKEFSAQRVPGAPDLSHAGEGPPRILPEVVVRDVDAAAGEEKPPPICSGLGVPSKTTIKNERDAQVVIMWVGLDCKEKFWERLEPKKTVVLKGRDGDAWRIRDAKTAAVLFDIVPDAPDTTTYITVP